MKRKFERPTVCGSFKINGDTGINLEICAKRAGLLETMWDIPG